MTRQRRIDDVLSYLGMLAIVVFFGGPLLWILSLSFRTQAEVLSTSLNPIPKHVTTSSYEQVLSSAQFPQFLLNSLILAIVAAIGTMLVGAPAAYGFSRVRFQGRKALLIGVLGLQMVSPLVVAFPLYRYFASLGMLDSIWAASLVYIAILTPLATWMMKGFFDGIPRDLDEAAMLDGCSRLQTFLRVILPVARSGLASVLILVAILAWGEFVVPYILLSAPSKLPISVGILNFQGTYAQNSTNILAAGGILAMLPAVAVFVLLQRFVVGAFLRGAVKG